VVFGVIAPENHGHLGKERSGWGLLREATSPGEEPVLAVLPGLTAGAHGLPEHGQFGDVVPATEDPGGELDGGGRIRAFVGLVRRLRDGDHRHRLGEGLAERYERLVRHHRASPVPTTITSSRSASRISDPEPFSPQRSVIIV